MTKVMVKVFAPDGGFMGVVTANEDQIEGIVRNMAEVGLTTVIIEEEVAA